MIRYRNWDLALRRWATSMAGQPFVWGTTDCASLALTAVGILYPRRTVLRLQPWTSQREALQLLTAHPRAIEDALEQLGGVALPLAFATTGDLLVLPAAPFPHLYVSLGAEILATDPEVGVHLGPVRQLAGRTDLCCYRIAHG